MNQFLRIVVCTVIAACVLCGCSTSQSTQTPWDAAFAPPDHLETSRVRFVPLKPELAQLDYDAFMSSREHLRETLRWGNWPSDDATVEGNREDLARHWREHQANEAYTYAVLTPDGSRYLACVYLKPLADDAFTDLPRPAVRVSYWVTERELATDLDWHLVRALHDWLTSDWSFQSIVMPLHRANERGREIASSNGYTLMPADPDDERLNYVFRN